MRVAACLSGHSRNYWHNFPNFPFEVEYFISSCMESGLPNENTKFFVSYHSQDNVRTDMANIDEIVQMYQPKAWEFLPDTNLPEEVQRYVGLKTTHGAYLHHIGMMFYRIYRANQLKCDHERTFNFTYDFVIRSRFDIKVNEFNFNKDYLYLVCDEGKVIDLFFAGKSYVMDAIANCYLWFIKQEPAYLQTLKQGEDIFYHYVKQLKLDLPALNTFHVTFNKDYPVQYNIIKNGMVRCFDQHGHVICDGEFRQ